MKTVILFDMDGVIADFAGGAIKAHGKSLPYGDIRWGFPAQIGFTGDGDPEFWKPLERRDFWANLEPLADGMKLFELVATELPAEQIGFLSSPLCPCSADGKRDWLTKHLPAFDKAAVFTVSKHLVAAPGKLLIDDWHKNTEPFEKHGGMAVLVPRPWNERSRWTCGNGSFDAERIFKEVMTKAA